MSPRNLLFVALFAVALADPVVGITDGDTLTVLHGKRQVKIRLANIDAPEKTQTFGQRSKQSLSDICYRKDATYQVQNIDRYGRTVAVVMCGRIEANRAQVERGMAWVYTQYNKDSSLPTIERAARASRKGLWAHASPTPPWKYRHPKSGVAHAPVSSSECHIGPRGGRYRIVNGHKRYGC